MTKDTAKDLSMFVLRFVLGVIFIMHGGQKLFGIFGGIGIEGTTKMMEGLGFAAPHSVALIWSCIEFAGGILLVLGIIARYSAILIIGIMLLSVWKINLAYGFFLQNGGFEYALLIIAACIPLVCMGGGSWSVWDV